MDNTTEMSTAEIIGDVSNKAGLVDYGQLSFQTRDVLTRLRGGEFPRLG